MATLARMQVDLVANTTGFTRDLSSAADRFQNFGRQLTAVGKTLTATVTAPILGIGAATFKMAADAAEAASKLDAVFGAEASKMNATIQELRVTIPGTTAELQAFAAALGDTFIPMGASAEHARELSTDVIKLAGDMASFSNVPLPQALADIQSGLAGQFEPLRKYATFLTKAKIEAEAKRLGLVNLKGEVDDLGIAQATLSLITESQALAFGDAARTADSAANSLKFLISDVKEAATNFGERLLPVLTPLIQKLREVVARFDSLSVKTQATIIAVGGAVAAIGPLLIVMGTLTRSFGALLPAVGGVVRILAPLAAGLASLNPVALGVGAAVAALGLAFAKWGKDTPKVVLEGARNIGKVFKELIDGPMVGLLTATGTLAVELIALYYDVANEVITAMGQMITGIWRKLDELRPVRAWVRDHFFTPVSNLFRETAEAVGTFVGKATGHVNNMRDEIANEDVPTMVETVTSKIGEMKDRVLASFGALKDGVLGTWDQLNTDLATKTDEVVATVGGGFEAMEIILPESLKKTQEKIETGIDSWKIPFTDRVRALVDDIGGEWSRIGQVLGVDLDRGLFDALQKWIRFANDVKNLIKGIIDFLGGGTLKDLADVFRGPTIGPGPGPGPTGQPPGGGGTLFPWYPPVTTTGNTQSPSFIAPEIRVDVSQVFHGPADAETVRGATIEAIDEALGRVTRRAARVHGGNMAVS